MEEEVLVKHGADHVTLSVTYGDETIGIYCTVREIFTENKELASALKEVLWEAMEGQLDSIPGIEKVKEPSPPPAPAKAKRVREPQRNSSAPPKKKKQRKQKEESVLKQICAAVQAWQPASKYKQRTKGRIFYLGLLQALQKVAVQQSLLERLRSYWQPVLSGSSTLAQACEPSFMKELATLTKECQQLPNLQSTVSRLIHEFRRG